MEHKNKIICTDCGSDIKKIENEPITKSNLGRLHFRCSNDNCKNKNIIKARSMSISEINKKGYSFVTIEDKKCEHLNKAEYKYSKNEDGTFDIWSCCMNCNAASNIIYCPWCGVNLKEIGFE